MEEAASKGLAAMQMSKTELPFTSTSDDHRHHETSLRRPQMEVGGREFPGSRAGTYVCAPTEIQLILSSGRPM